MRHHIAGWYCYWVDCDCSWAWCTALNRRTVTVCIDCVIIWFEVQKQGNVGVKEQSSSLSPLDACDLNFFRQGELGSLVCMTAGFQLDSKWWHHVSFHHRNALCLVWYHCKCCSCFEMTCNSWCTDTLGSLLKHVPEIYLLHWWSFPIMGILSSSDG